MKNKIIFILVLIILSIGLTGCSFNSKEEVIPKYIDVEEEGYSLKNTIKLYLEGNGNITNIEGDDYTNILELKSYNENVKILGYIQDNSDHLPRYILYKDENVILFDFNKNTKTVIVEKDNYVDANYVLNYDVNNNKVLGYITYVTEKIEENGNFNYINKLDENVNYYTLDGNKTEIELSNLKTNNEILGFYNNVLIYQTNQNSQCGENIYYYDVINKNLKDIKENLYPYLYNKTLFYLTISDCNFNNLNSIYNAKFEKIIDNVDGYSFGEKIYIKKDYNTLLTYKYDGTFDKEIKYQYVYSLHDGYALVYDENIKKLAIVDLLTNHVYEIFDFTEDDRLIDYADEQFNVSYYKNININFDTYTATLNLETEEVTK